MKIQLNNKMAKIINPIIRLQGNFQNIVFVKSKVYGDHVRSKRGSIKPASVNDTLQAHADKTKTINAAAKRVHDLLKAYAGNFKESLLWQELLSRMRKSTTIEFVALLQQLDGLDINSKYPLKRFGKIPTVLIKLTRKKLLLTLNCYIPPHFKNGNDSYYYEVCVLFFNKKNEQDELTTAQTEWMDKVDKVKNWLFEFDVSKRAEYFLVLLKMQSGMELQEKVELGSVGIGVVGGGRI